MEERDIKHESLQNKAIDSESVACIKELYSGKVFPNQVVSTLRSAGKIFPVRIVPRGPASTPLERSNVQLRDIHLESEGKTYDLFDFMSRNRVAGLLILKNSEVVFEKYEFDNSEKTRWASMSMAKSISSTLVGAAIKDGFIDSVDDHISKYLPELTDSGYRCVTIKQLLQMTSGVRWDESYLDPGSDRRHVLDLQISQEPGATMRYLATRPSIAQPGTVWNYSTGDTHVVGALLRACTGIPVAEYLSQKIWSRIGTESDATWWLESPGGLEFAGAGITATLRDYGRFALFIMNGGLINGEQVLPEGWVEESGAPREIGGEPVNYGFMWWPVPEGSNNVGAFSARGIFGQYMYINPKKRVVVVVWSARSKPLDAHVIADNDFFNAVVKALK